VSDTPNSDLNPSAEPADAATPVVPATPATPAEPDPPPSPVAAPKPKKSGPAAPFIWGTGRRKASVARVRIRPGEGTYLINNRKVDEFFCLDKDRNSARQPLAITDSLKTYDVFVNVGGGGITGQAGAVLLGLARALVKANPDCEAKLREKNLLRRDPRRVERKKYGLRGARRAYQFSKR